MNYLKLFLFALIMMLSGWVKGQSELEIKTTGKYIYSWAIEKDQASAREAARLGLLDTIFVSLLQEPTIDQTDTVFIKEIDYFENKIGFKWQAIAFADKANVEVKLEQRKKIKVIPIIIGDQKISTNRYMANSDTDQNATSKKEGPDPKGNHIDSINFNTGNLVLDQLLTSRDAKSLERQLYKFKTELKLNYGFKENYPDDSGCYIFVIENETKMVVAVYDKGTGMRKDFLTQVTDNNFADKYKGNIFVYVVIN